MKTRHLVIGGILAFVALEILGFAGVWLLTRGARQRPTRDSASYVADAFLVSKEGERFVGEQLRFFLVDGDGVISATNIAFINLYHTEAKPFRLTGLVWLEPDGSVSHGDLPDGFALFIREWDSLHRYSLRSRSMEVKRRMHSGASENGIKQAVSFRPPAFATWLPFAAEVSAESISFQIGDQSGVIQGPVDVDGANKIALAPGTKLKDVRLEMLGEARPRD